MPRSPGHRHPACPRLPRLERRSGDRYPEVGSGAGGSEDRTRNPRPAGCATDRSFLPAQRPKPPNTGDTTRPTLQRGTDRHDRHTDGLVRRGYMESIVISHDASCFMDFVSVEEHPRPGEKWSYRLMSTEVIPALLQAGAADRSVETILVDDQRRHFEGARA
ncbi:hypothetical protein ACQP1K_03910 [Sphaerimonospora sp. CA-214678]|uniref:phosphotriesterase family protein n=1 Tax=Sphaerimonospora sp. CA-214678 TaxID=3240029 RepID=UPI003D8A4944